MIRGTTPTLIFSDMPLDCHEVNRINIMFKQDNELIFVKTKDDCEISTDGSTLTVELTEEETLKLDDGYHAGKPEGIVEIQIKIEDENGKITASQPMRARVGKILDDWWVD